MENIRSCHTGPRGGRFHHLFPTFDKFNSRRSNFPFREIPDAETKKWLIELSATDSIPTSNIDGYSESANNAFEPRESHKGNVARAVFYFYTMYPQYPMSRVGDINMLYAWHLADAVDQAEKDRNAKIAAHQGNRNPYVDNPELVCLAWEVDKDEAKVILISMSKDPGLVDQDTCGSPTGGGCDEIKAAAIKVLESAASELEATLSAIRAEIEKLKKQ